MISVGVDVSKGKSTICVLKPYGEIVCSPFEVLHVEKELEGLDNLLQKLDGEIRIVMEATGIYHLPILSFLQEKGYFVSVVNPYAMKKYAKDNSIRGAKTDRLDSSMINCKSMKATKKPTLSSNFSVAGTATIWNSM